MTVKDDCDCAISIDADLQDDIHVIPDMVRNFIDGYDVVYGVRNKRDTDTFFKRTTAVGFYKLMQFMGVNIVFNHADYRLMSKRALDGLAQFPERNLFLRGMVPPCRLSLNKCILRQKRTLCGRVKISVKENAFICV